MKSMIRAMLLAACAPACAQEALSLSADKEPADKAWENPATLAYTRNGDHTTNSTIDAYLEYTMSGPYKGTSAVGQNKWAVAGYVHRDSDQQAPRNDRGIALTYSRGMVSDFSNAGMPRSMAINAKVTVGKALQGVTDSAGATSYPDRNKDRESVYFSGYFQPTKSGPVPDPAPKRPLEMFFNWKAGVYSDHVSGGDNTGAGRLSGSVLGLSLNLFPFGLAAADNALGAYGVVPVITLSAQHQRDFASSRGRVEDTYKLYAATLTLEFNTLTGSGIARLKPSLNLSRSMGADLLLGRAREGKTELSLGLTF